jgi:fluoride exporter
VSAVADGAGTELTRSPADGAQADVVAVIAVGGALGGLGRWALSEAIPWEPGAFPWATFLENVAGGLLLGALMVVLLEVLPPGRYARPFLGVGLLGGFTTFSTYTSETRSLLLDGEPALAMGYLLGTLVACLLATWAGVFLARAASGTDRPGRRRRR